MTPSSRVGRRIAPTVSFSIIALSVCALVSSAEAAPAGHGSNSFQGVNTGVSGPVWTRPQAGRLNGVTAVNMRRDPRSTAVHHLGLPRAGHRLGYGPTYVSPVANAVYPQTTIVQSPVTVSQPAPAMVWQPACVSPLIISIEAADSRHVGQHGRGDAGSAQIVRGTSQSCLPERITVRTGPAVHSVSARF